MSLSSAEKERKLFAAQKAIEPYKQAQNKARDNQHSINACTALARDYSERLAVFTQTATTQAVRQEFMHRFEQQIKVRERDLGQEL